MPFRQSMTNAATTLPRLLLTLVFSIFVLSFSNTAASAQTPPQPFISQVSRTFTTATTEIRLTWNASTATVNTYQVFRRLEGGTYATTSIAITPGSVTSYSDTVINDGTKYFYVIKAVNSGGSSLPSNEVSTSARLAMPKSFIAIPGDRQVSLSWGAVPNATSYNLQYWVPGAAWVAITPDITSTSYVHTNLTNGTRYTYSLAAKNPLLYGSDFVNAATTPGTPYLPVPNPFTALPGDSQVTLSWGTVLGATKYNLWRQIGDGSTNYVKSLSNVTSYVDAGLSNGVRHSYTIQAENAGVSISDFAWTSATPAITTPATGAPTAWAVSLNLNNTLGGVATTGTVTLTGIAPSGGSVVTLSSSNNAVARVPSSVTVSAGSQTAPFNVTTFPVSATTNVTISADSGGVRKTTILTVTPPVLSSLSLSPSIVVGGNSSVGTITLTGNAPSGGIAVVVGSDNTSCATVLTPVTVPGGTNTTTFPINTTVVSAMATAVISASYGGTIETEALTVMSAVPVLTRTFAGDKRIVLFWREVPSAISYNIKRATRSGGPYSPLTTIPATSYLEASYNDFSVENGTLYYYVVSANNANGETLNSNQVSATPIGIPDRPTITASPGNARVTLTWTASHPAGPATQYSIVRRAPGESVYRRLTTVNDNASHSYTDVGLTNGYTYSYMVDAGNSVGNSPLSSPVSATPNFPPAQPMNLVVTSSGLNNSLSWTASNYTTSYKVKRGLRSGGPYATIAENLAASNYLDSGVDKQKTYYYVVTSVNTTGESAPSNEAVALGLPGAVEYSNVKATELTTYLPQSTGETSLFSLQRATATPATGALPPSAGLATWLRSDLVFGLDNDSILSELPNAAPVGPSGVQNNSSLMPRWLMNSRNGRPTIRFDGQDDFLKFTNNQNVRAAFIVAKHRTGIQDFATLLGHNTAYDFHGGPGTQLFDATSLNPSIRDNGQVFVNGTSQPPLTVTKPTSYQVVSFISAAPVSASYLANDREMGGRFWDGEIAEVLLYDVALTAQQRQSVESYLSRKYGIAYSPAPNSPWITVANNLQGAATFKDTGLSPDTTYLYRAVAQLSGGGSTEGLISSVTTLPLAPLAPNAPSSFSNVSSNSVTVTAPGLPSRAVLLNLQRKPSDAPDSQYQTLARSIRAGEKTAVILPVGSFAFRYLAVNEGGATPGPKANTFAVGSNDRGLTAQYFRNENLSNLSYTRIDPQVDFDWAFSTPGQPLGADNFSVRWLGQVQPLHTQTYTFSTNADEGVRLWVNNQLLVDSWNQAGIRSGTISLIAGQRYNVRLEYREGTGTAYVRLRWSSLSQPEQIIPRSQLYPGDVSNISNQGLRGQYYNDVYLTNLALVRQDPVIDFSWAGSPAAGVTPDFSVLWSGEIVPPNTEQYTFYTNTDDGALLWVNGQLLVNNWYGIGERSATIQLQAGQRYSIKMAFCDRGVGAVAKLMWSSPTLPKQLVSPNHLIPATQNSTPPQLPLREGIAAQHISSEVPTKMFTGRKATVRVTFRNIGTSTWPRGDDPATVLQKGYTNLTIYGIGTIWRTPGHIFLNRDVAPREEITVEFDITAPQNPGRYEIWCQLHRGALNPDGTVSASIEFADASSRRTIVVEHEPQGVEVVETSSSTAKLRMPVANPGVGSFTLQRKAYTLLPGETTSLVPSITGLKTWLSAESMATENTLPVSTWRDASGNKNHSVQANPLLRPQTIVKALGGRPSLRFDGVNDFLPLAPELQSNFSVLAVVRSKRTIPMGSGRKGYRQGNLFTTWFDTATPAGAVLSWGSNGAVVSELAHAYDPVMGVYNQSIGTGFNVAEMSYLNDRSSLYLNGQLAFQGAVPLAAGIRSPTKLGGSPEASIDGEISEVLIYDHPLTTTERRQTSDYLIRRYNITAGQVPDNTGWTSIASGLAAKAEYVDTGLNPNTSYWYRCLEVRGTNTEPTAPARATTRPLPPTAPGAPVAGVSAPTSIQVTAPPLPTGALWMILHRKLPNEPDGAYEKVAQPVVGSEVTTAQGLTNNTTYRFRYVSWGSGGEAVSTQYKDYTTTSTSIPPGVPGKPVVSNMTSTGNLVSITVKMPSLPPGATSLNLQYSRDSYDGFAAVLTAPGIPTASSSSSNLKGGAVLQVSNLAADTQWYNRYHFRCVAVGLGGMTPGPSVEVTPSLNPPPPISLGEPSFINIQPTSVTVIAPQFSGILQGKESSAPDDAYRNYTTAGPRTDLEGLIQGATYSFRYVAFTQNATVEGPSANVTLTSPVIQWQPGSPLECAGIRWPFAGTTIPAGARRRLSSFLATDWDLKETTTANSTILSRLTDSSTYTWSASGGSFVNGPKGQSVEWQAPGTAGIPGTPTTYTITLVIDDQGGANKPVSEIGSRDDGSLGYNDAPLRFSTTVVVK